MQKVKKYHLHKNEHFKLHFEVNDAKPYIEKNAKHCFIPHQHSFYQVIWFKTAGQHFIDYETVEHEANTFISIDKGQIHYFCKDSENQGFLFHFNDFFLQKQGKDAEHWLRNHIFNGMGKPLVVPDEDDLEEMAYLTNFIQKEIQNKSQHYQRQVYFLFQSILLKIERLKSAQQTFSNQNDRDFELIIEFQNLVEKDLNKFYTVDKYSENLNISSKKLSNLSKKYLDKTPASFIQDRKILEAKRLLSNAKLSIKEVAFHLGFEQATYFTKYFKKNTSMTPKTFVEEFIHQN